MLTNNQVYRIIDNIVQKRYNNTVNTLHKNSIRAIDYFKDATENLNMSKTILERQVSSHLLCASKHLIDQANIDIIRAKTL